MPDVFETIERKEFNWGSGVRSDQPIALDGITCALQICKDTMKPITYPAPLRLVVSSNLGTDEFGALPLDIPLVIADGGAGSTMVLNGKIQKGQPVNDLYVFEVPVKLVAN